MKMMTRLLGQYVYGIHLSQASNKHASGGNRRKGISTKHRNSSAESSSGNKGAATADPKSDAARAHGHRRDQSISKTLEQFTGDPVTPKPPAMAAVQEAGEQTDDEVSSRTPSAGQTSASLRSLRDSAKSNVAGRRHRSEPNVSKAERPPMLGYAASIDMSSPLRDVEPRPTEEQEMAEGLESVESQVSIQGYNVQRAEGTALDEKDEMAESVCSSEEKELTSSSGEEDDDEEEVEGSASGKESSLLDYREADTGISDMTESLLADDKSESLLGGSDDKLDTQHPGSGREQPPSSGSATPIGRGSDPDDDFRPSKQRDRFDNWHAANVYGTMSLKLHVPMSTCAAQIRHACTGGISHIKNSIQNVPFIHHCTIWSAVRDCFLPFLNSIVGVVGVKLS